MSNDSLPIPPRTRDLTGKVFSRLTVVGYAGRTGSGKLRWHTVCTCGSKSITQGVELTTGGTRSCGCLRAESASQKATHRMKGSPEYNTWCHMWARCTNPNNKEYHRYKGRTPPPEWRSFEVFFAELGPKPGPEYSLDRVDNEKPYGPGNCRWATQYAQQRNRSDNVWVTTLDGRDLCLTDACKLTGLVRATVSKRVANGQTLEQASNGLFREAA